MEETRQAADRRKKEYVRVNISETKMDNDFIHCITKSHMSHVLQWSSSTVVVDVWILL
jgi:hypothetical protein